MGGTACPLGPPKPVLPLPSNKCPPPQVFSTYSNEDYDRRNEDVDPMAASAEYELEKRVERLELFPVELEKGEWPGPATWVSSPVPASARGPCQQPTAARTPV